MSDLRGPVAINDMRDVLMRTTALFGGGQIEPYASYERGPFGVWRVTVAEWRDGQGTDWGWAFTRYGRPRAEREAAKRVRNVLCKRTQELRSLAQESRVIDTLKGSQ